MLLVTGMSNPASSIDQVLQDMSAQVGHTHALRLMRVVLFSDKLDYRRPLPSQIATLMREKLAKFQERDVMRRSPHFEDEGRAA